MPLVKFKQYAKKLSWGAYGTDAKTSLSLINYNAPLFCYATGAELFLGEAEKKEGKSVSDENISAPEAVSPD